MNNKKRYKAMKKLYGRYLYRKRVKEFTDRLTDKVFHAIIWGDTEC